MTKLYRTWCDRFAGITNTQAVRFCKGPFLQAIGEQSMHGTTSMTDEECQALLYQIRHYGVLVAGQSNSVGFNGDDAERGRQWLRANERKFGFPHLDWGAITHFTFVDVHIHDRSPRGYRVDARPVYRAHWANGDTFDYSPSPWQAGMTLAQRKSKPVHFKYRPAQKEVSR